MLTIRPDQVEAFSKSALKNFEDRMIEHIGRFFPKQLAASGEPQMRETVRYGIQRAQTYAIVAERDVCKYIDLIVLLGRDFEDNPHLGWVHKVLDESASKSPGYRLDRIFEAAEQKLQE